MTIVIEVPQIEPCETRVFELAYGGWRRLCLTCGRDQYPMAERGPHVTDTDTEAEAWMSARAHTAAMLRGRQFRAWRAEWSRLIRECHDWPTFVLLMMERQRAHQRYVGAYYGLKDFDTVPEGRREGLMATIRQIEGGR